MAHRSGPAVLLVRHGETEWSLSGQHTGTTDIPLTEAGEGHARRLAPRLAGHDFALVLTSPLERARRSAALAEVGEDPEATDDLLEWNYGEYEGITTPQIRERTPEWDLWRDGCPGGETAAQVGARCDRVIERVRAAEGDVVLFAHGHVLRVLGARWAGLPAEAGAALALGTASLCDLGFERDNQVIWLWNDTGHLHT